MTFQKEHIPWNKGKRGLQVAWNKGKLCTTQELENIGSLHKNGLNLHEVASQLNRSVSFIFNRAKELGLATGSNYNRSVSSKKAMITKKERYGESCCSKEGLKRRNEAIRQYQKEFGNPLKEYLGQKLYGAKNPNWKGGIGYEPYSSIFYGELKELIRKRDNYTCQSCGRKQKEEIEKNHEKLSIHHIDYNKKNNVPSNLIALCRVCNSKANSERDYWFNYFHKVATFQVSVT